MHCVSLKVKSFYKAVPFIRGKNYLVFTQFRTYKEMYVLFIVLRITWIVVFFFGGGGGGGGCRTVLRRWEEVSRGWRANCAGGCLLSV